MAANTHISLFVRHADDPTVVVLITKSNEMAYKQKVRQLDTSCKVSDLFSNINKINGMVVDFRKSCTAPYT